MKKHRKEYQKVKKMVREGFEKLLEEVKEGKTERLEKYLKFASNFHRYSPNNMLLIQLQCPHATRVAGYRKWQKLGYQVKKGEKAIKILAPMTYKKKVEKKDEDGNVVRDEEGNLVYEEKQVTYFGVVNVFDISQTIRVKDEEDVTEFFFEIEGDCAKEYNLLKSLIQEDGIKVEEVERVGADPKAEGASYGGKIEVKKGSSVNMTLTLIHEWGHEILHQKNKEKQYTKEQKECQAEAVSFIVSNYLGIYNPFSRDYLIGWGNDVKELENNLKEVMEASSYIIEKIEKLRERKKKKNKKEAA